MTDLERMKEINKQLVEACNAYYLENNSIMTDYDYDSLYDELLSLEQKTGTILSDSVTQNVGAEVISSLAKENHEEKALSLDKTKSIDDLASWLGDKKGFLSWKLDGITLVLTYDNGNLTKAVTRGNGEIGEVITHNAKHILGIPKKIPFTGHLVLRGECFMTYSDFNRINVNGEYKNPRNLASGTARALDSNVVKKRTLHFQAFELVSSSKGLPSNSFDSNIQYLKKLGFDVVDGGVVDAELLKEIIPLTESKITNNDFPSDGLVLQYDDIKYGKSLGTTGKFPRWGKAFKWKDETAETTIRDIVWQTSRTGLINPVVVFDPVDLEGTTVQRATANNISFMNKHNLTVGSKILVYKANMIIPTILKNTNPVGVVSYPDKCPTCGGVTEIVNTGEADVLMCSNPNCSAKSLKHFVHFVSRDAMNITGISENTLDKLIKEGYLEDYTDLYKLEDYPEIANLEGFGDKSYEKMLDSIENSRNVYLSNFIYAFGIENIGRRVSKDLAKYADGDIDNFITMLESGEDFTEIDGVGDIIQDSIDDFWGNETNRQLFNDLADLMNFKELKQTDSSNSLIAGKTFCVTGKVYIFDNRKAVEKWLEERGAKLTSSVTSKTDYLMTNDTTSGSAKNKKAQQLGTKIITESELLAMDK